MRALRTVPTICSGILLFLSLCCAWTPAHAERVLVHSKAGTEGHGWLFGASTGEKCWIAVPTHVVASPETGELEPFYFFDANGNSGESAVPIGAAPEGQITAADREASDLAFARVKVGRIDGQCHSRLGLPTYAYKAILRRNTGFSVFTMFKTSTGAFDVRLDRKSVDAIGGALINFSTTDARAKKFIRKGVSGAAVTANYNGEAHPVAMVLSVLEDYKTLRALRFDYIRTCFDHMKWPDKEEYRQDKSDGNVNYKIIQTKHIPLPGDSGVSSLRSESGCWKAMAPGGKRVVELTIAVLDSNSKVESLEVLQSPQCNGGPVHYWVEQRTPASSAWAYVTAGKSEQGKSNPCRIGLSAPREFRIRFDAKKPVTLSGLRLR